MQLLPFDCVVLIEGCRSKTAARDKNANAVKG